MNNLRYVQFLAGLAVLAGLAALSGCIGPSSYGGMGYTNTGGTGSSGGTGNTISGTIALTNLGATGYAYVTATIASYPYSTYVLVPVAISGVQTMTYSVGGLPAGTYSVKLAVSSPNAAVSGSYQVNAGPAVSDPPASAGSGPYTWTMTINSLSVSANVQLDAAMK